MKLAIEFVKPIIGPRIICVDYIPWHHLAILRETMAHPITITAAWLWATMRMSVKITGDDDPAWLVSPPHTHPKILNKLSPPGFRLVYRLAEGVSMPELGVRVQADVDGAMHGDFRFIGQYEFPCDWDDASLCTWKTFLRPEVDGAGWIRVLSGEPDSMVPWVGPLPAKGQTGGPKGWRPLDQKEQDTDTFKALIKWADSLFENTKPERYSDSSWEELVEEDQLVLDTGVKPEDLKSLA